MSRRLGIALLIGCIALGGRFVCPRGVMQCNVWQQANHDCCGGQALRGSDCCCQDTQRSADMGARGVLGQSLLQHAVIDVAVTWPAEPPAVGARATADILDGLGPPETLVHRHIALLL
jgi:hypothetical protein